MIPKLPLPKVTALLYAIKRHSYRSVKDPNFLKTRKRGYLWITFSFFIMSLAIHCTFAWFAYADELAEHNQPTEFTGYFNQTFRDTMENWQSEFLQLMWQVGGLFFLLYVGAP